MPGDSQKPRFSFLTTAYKTESYVAETIDSVVGQTRADWELVVVDNGNADAIAAIVGGYADDPRIRLVRQDNKGYSGGVMAAAAVACGDFFCVLDSDDLVTPTFLEVVQDFLESHPDADAVGCDAYLFADGGTRSTASGYFRSIDMRSPPRGGARLTLEDMLAGRIPYYTGAIRREAWRDVGGYQPGIGDIEEDVAAWLRLADRFNVYLLPDRVARCRMRAESLSRDPESIERFERRLIRTFELFASESGRPEHLHAVERTVRRLKYHQALRRARWSFLNGDIDVARRFALDAYRQRRTVRTAAVVTLLAAAPGMLSAVYPLKQRLALARRRMLPRV